MSASQTPVTVLDGYVPIIDLGLGRPSDLAGRMAVAEAISGAFATSGFLVATGHAVPDATISAMYAANRRFFAQDEAARSAVLADPLDPLQRGYSPDDRLQMFSANRLGEPQAAGEPLSAANRWPALTGFRDSYLAYYAATTALALELMRHCALALGLPQSWFDDKFDRHMTPLTANYYPARPDAGRDARIRNEPHTDFTAMTILYQDSSPGGLQVRQPDGRWVDVPPVPGTFVVNLGRLMTMWTNDRWACTTHRVLNPPPEHRHRDRISIAFFYQPNPDAIIECIPTCADDERPARYNPVSSADYLTGKARRAYLTRRARENSRE